jgi:hypothetical protein
MSLASLLRAEAIAPATLEDEPTAQATRWQFAALGGAAALFLYLHLFHFPFVPVWRWGDQSIYLLHADRMLQGAVLYRDLFQFNLPGTEYLYYALFSWFGPALWVAPLALLLTGTAVTLLTFSLSRKVLPGVAALLPPVTLLVIGQRSNLDAAHHWYSTLLVLLAVNLIAERCNPARLGAAGALLGLASLFTSSRGVFVVAGVSVFLLWKLRPGRDAAKALAALLLPFAAVVGGAMLYLAHMVGTKLLLDSVLVFPLRYYSADNSSNSLSIFWGEFQAFLPLRWQSFLLVPLWLVLNVGVPLTLIAFFAGPFRRRAAELRNSAAGQRLVQFALVGSALVLAVASAPSAARLNCAAPFAFVVAAAMLRQISGRRLLHGALAVMVLLGLAELAVVEIRWSGKLDGPRGAVIIQEPEIYAEYAWVAQHARPGDSLFGDPSFNFVLGLKNPTPLPFVTANGYTRPEQVQSVLLGLEHQHTRFIIWSDEAENSRAPDDNLQPLRHYLHEHYRLVQRFDDGTEILDNDRGADLVLPQQPPPAH